MANILRLMVVCFTLATPVLAVAIETKVGFVNRERILREAAPAKRAQLKLEKEFANRQAELNKMEKQGRDLEATLAKEAVTSPEAERVARGTPASAIDARFSAHATRISRRLEPAPE